MTAAAAMASSTATGMTTTTLSMEASPTAATVIELGMMAAAAIVSFPGMVRVKVRMIAPAIAPTSAQAV